MQAKLTYKNDTNVKITVSASAEILKNAHETVLKQMRSTMKLPGFREGKAPLNIIEKNADQGRLQANFIDEAVNELYRQIVIAEDLRPVAQPSISVKKFVPFSLLEVEIEVEVIGKTSTKSLFLFRRDLLTPKKLLVLQRTEIRL